jgi:hypothetical protein
MKIPNKIKAEQSPENKSSLHFSRNRKEKLIVFSIFLSLEETTKKLPFLKNFQIS